MKLDRVRGVYRREDNCPGWIVRRWNGPEGKAEYLGFFADGAHGGKRKSLMLAQKLSMDEGDGDRMTRRCYRVNKSKKSGLPLGICYVRRKKGAKATAIRAHIRVDGVIYYQDFPIKQSEKNAIKKAIQHRKRLERQAFGEETPS